jgi:hypothetical protein
MNQQARLNQAIRPKVIILSFSLLGPILLVTHIVTHSFSTSVFASPTASNDEPSCSEMKTAVLQTQGWIELYQPLASRGGIYRKAYQEHLSRNASARKSLSTCSN